MRKLSLEADTRRFRLLALAILIGTAVLLGTWRTRAGWQPLAHVPAAAGAVWLSKLAIFSGAIAGFPFSPWTLALVAWVLDLLAAVAMLSGLPLLANLQLAGSVLGRVRHRAFLTLQRYPGLERMALFGVGLFVFVPIPGSGSMVGTLIGQAVGLSRTATLLVVALGSALSVCTLALVADQLGQRWESLVRSPLTAALGFVLLLSFGWFAGVKVRRQLKRP